MVPVGRFVDSVLSVPWCLSSRASRSRSSPHPAESDVQIVECRMQRQRDGALTRKESPKNQSVDPGEDIRGGGMISRGVLGAGAGDAAASPEICCPQEGGVCRSLCRTVDLKGVERCRFRSESARSERLCKSGIYPIVGRLVKNREKSELMEEVPGRCSRSSRPTRDQIHPEKVSAKSLGPVVGHGASPIRS